MQGEWSTVEARSDAALDRWIYQACQTDFRSEEVFHDVSSIGAFELRLVWSRKSQFFSKLTKAHTIVKFPCESAGLVAVSFSDNKRHMPSRM